MNRFTKLLEFDEQKHEYNVLGTKLPSVTEIIGPLTYTKYRVDNAVVEQAAFRGSMIHALTAAYDRGDLDEDGEVAVDVGLYLMAWISFCHDYQPKWEYIEIPMATRTFAGTIDRVGVIDGKRVVVDIKTTSAMDRANKIALVTQLYGYSQLCAENDVQVDYDNSIGVQLKNDGKYSVIRTGAVSQKYQFNPAELWCQLRFLNTLLKGEKNAE